MGHWFFTAPKFWTEAIESKPSPRFRPGRFACKCLGTYLECLPIDSNVGTFAICIQANCFSFRRLEQTTVYIFVRDTLSSYLLCATIPPMEFVLWVITLTCNLIKTPVFFISQLSILFIAILGILKSIKLLIHARRIWMVWFISENSRAEYSLIFYKMPPQLKWV